MVSGHGVTGMLIETVILDIWGTCGRVFRYMFYMQGEGCGVDLILSPLCKGIIKR